MTESKFNLVLIGDDELTLKKQLSILSCLDNVQNKVIIPSKSIFDAIKKHALKANNIVIINLTANGLKELQFLNEIEDRKAAFIIIGDKKNIELLSQAIHTGVKGFVHYQDYVDTLDDIFCNIKKSITHVTGNSEVRRLNVFISAKGGSGVSFIASNVAYMLSKNPKTKVALIDLDMQFGSIGHNFDTVPKYNLTEALNAIDDLDSTSLAAYMSKYNENLSLLLPSPLDIVLPGEINLLNLRKLLELVRDNYNQVIIDLPRLIDPVSTMVMEQADQITLVLQQTLAQFRDGRQLIQILNKDLEIPFNKITIVINRYDVKNSLRIEDLKNIVNHNQVYVIANDHEHVVNSSNIGVPLCEASANFKITEDISDLAKILGQVELNKEDDNLFGRIKSYFK